MLKKTTRGMTAGMTRRGVGFAVAGGGGPTYLLDTYSGAAAAYSLRRLNTAYTGPVVQVRRSGDSAEDTFSADEVGDGTLAAWVTAGGGTEDGFVKTWYDQSGNGNDASQATAASQPQIVASGAVLLNDSSKPVITFDGVSDTLVAIGVGSPINVWMYFKLNAILSGNRKIYGTANSIFRTYYQSGSVYSGSTVITTAPGTTAYRLADHLWKSASSSFKLDGTETTGDPGNTSGTSFAIASNGSNEWSSISVGECIIATTESVYREGISEGIASHYGITLS